MDLTRREFSKAILGAAGAAALGPAVLALPEPMAHGYTSLAPLEQFLTGGPEIHEIAIFQTGGDGRSFHFSGNWRIRKPGPRISVEQRELILVEREFTDAERPGTGGGVVGKMLDGVEFYDMGPYVAVSLRLDGSGNRIPEPLWLWERGTLRI